MSKSTQTNSTGISGILRSMGKSSSTRIARPKGETLGETTFYSPQERERTLAPSLLIWIMIGVLLAVLCFITAAAQAQTLTVDSNISNPSNFDQYSAVQWNGAYTLTLTQPSNLNQTLINTDQPNAVLLLSGPSLSQPWSITTGNSSKWTGTTTLSGAALDVSSSRTYALGTYDTTGATGSYATTRLEDISTLNIQTDVAAGEMIVGKDPESLTSTDSASINVANGKTLTVYNGFDVQSNTTLTKTGSGTINLKTTKNSAISFDNAALYVQEGTFTVSKGNTTFSNSLYVPDSEIAHYVGGDFAVGTNGVLDIQNPGTMTIDSLAVANGGQINFYVDTKNGSNTVYNVSAGDGDGTTDIGTATFNIVSDLKTKTPDKMNLVLSDGNLGTGDKSNITVYDNVLGKHYVLQSTDEGNFVVVSDNSEKLLPHAWNTNTHAEANYLDNAINNVQYNSSMYSSLESLILSPGSMNQLTGELYASAIAREFMNNNLIEQTVFEHLRAVPLVTWTGNSTNGNTAASPYGDNPYGYSSGGLDTSPYGTGYAPVYENGVPMGWNGPKESIFDDGVIRGQQLGDPGTLIYSGWGTVLAGKGETSNHGEYYGYDSRQYGGLIGLDLFCCSDCRSGLFYSYMQDKITETPSWYGSLKSNEHTLGYYQLFGDEFVYNILMLRGVYSHWKADRNIAFPGVRDTLDSKVKDYQGSASYERGANFGLGSNATITPFAGVGYTFMWRDKFEESSSTNSGFALRADKKIYHSLHTNLGARANLKLLQSCTKLDLNVHGIWVHEFLDFYDGRTEMGYSGISSDAGSFMVYGNTMGRDWCLAGAGVEWVPVPALLVYANLDFLKNKYVADYYGTVGAKIRW